MMPLNNSCLQTKENPVAIPVADIPVLDYSAFAAHVDELLLDKANHCLTYFAYPCADVFRFICCMASDESHSILIFSHEQPNGKNLVLESLTARHFSFHVFERDIHEKYGIGFAGHPWLKPLRFPKDSGLKPADYPFYSIESDELHEVGVGPIHAGIIEPGHFRFICNGEKVLHLEIQLGYQHRGIEKLFSESNHLLQRSVLSESISGDSVIGHALCHATLTEALAGKTINDNLAAERIIALELERIAMHIGDTAGLCTDIAYQFGQVVNEALRTIVINTTQFWCGNRFGKGLIRPLGNHYPLNAEIIQKIRDNLEEVKERYLQITDRMFTMPSVLSRFEGIGRVSAQQALLTGAVGMAARSANLKRDIRWSHPFQYYKNLAYEPVLFSKGDVWSRARLREKEVEQSIAVINQLLDFIKNESLIETPVQELNLQPGTFAISLTEGWRGEICHAAITDEKGRIVYYKVKDPSLHNWMSLALALRGVEISDFPINNKSFNLSYCGHDL